MKTYLFAAAMLAGIAGSANASIIPVLVEANSPTDLGNGTFSYDYTATLASKAALVSGDYFTLYDFGDFVSVVALPMNWQLSTANLGKTPSSVLPDDDASVINLTFTYNGPTLNYSNDPAQHQEITFSPFTIISRSGVTALDSFTSLTVKNEGGARGTPIQTIGQVAVPLEGGGAGSTVPEPASWALLIAGFGLTGTTMRRRRITTVAA